MKLVDVLLAQGTIVPFLCLLVGSWVVYHLLRIIYNLSPFHPLSSVPGPILSRATHLPEFYYELIKFGRYTKRIEQMHREYGPIVRINPDEVHCCDVNFIDEIYTLGGRKRNKTQRNANSTLLSESAFGTAEHDLHRRRRTSVIKFFSRGIITKLESDIHDLAHLLCDKLLSSVSEPVDLVIAYSCFSSDAIASYSFGDAFGFLERDGWFSDFHTAELEILRPIHVLRFFPFLGTLARSGHYFLNYLPKDIALMVRTLNIDMPNMMRKSKEELDSGAFRDRPTVFSSILSDPKRSIDVDPSAEAATLLGAGTETTAWTLTVTTYHLLSKPEFLAKLREELSQVVEDPRHLPTWTVLEGLPYLQAVVREGLRLSYGVPGRLSRVPIDEHLVYHGSWKGKPVAYVIPRGYGIGMSSGIMHHDENLFPHSYSFIPERWLDEQTRKQLDRGFIPFSRGSRACLGMNLAMCEFYVAISALALRVLPYMQLFETTTRDIEYDYDMLIPLPVTTSKGVRVTISPQ
ncbi:cytochrome P450 [Hypoxylon sp. FL1284]|nr:cytochrome P450 [Hypoxylon sp. FL1284]